MERAGTARSPQHLEKVAISLLRGCEQHFRSQVTRVKRIGGVVAPGLEIIFENYATSLLRCDNIEDLTRIAAQLIKDFPMAKDWMEWWMRPAHATMLFKSARTMAEELWNSIPSESTTNPAESMHMRMYAAVGRDHVLFDGMKKLVDFVNILEAQYTGKSRMCQMFWRWTRENSLDHRWNSEPLRKGATATQNTDEHLWTLEAQSSTVQHTWSSRTQERLRWPSA
jgi:hypothetical protein